MGKLSTKRNVVLTLVLGAVLTFAGWSQTWVTLHIVATDVRVKELVASGQASTVLPAGLALVSLATGLVLLTSRRSLTYVIGGINAAVGLGLMTLVPLFAVDPINFEIAQLSKLSGISDSGALHELVGEQSLGFGLWVTMLGGALVLGASVVLFASAHRWNWSRSRYDAPSSSLPRDQEKQQSTLDAWDDLTRGTDPTA